MSKRLYVGNLAFHSTEDSLRTAFEGAGVEVLSIQLMTDRMTGQSRGFGFVEVSDAQAQAAINALHGKDLDGRTLTINRRASAPAAPAAAAAAVASAGVVAAAAAAVEVAAAGAAVAAAAAGATAGSAARSTPTARSAPRAGPLAP